MFSDTLVLIIKCKKQFVMTQIYLYIVYLHSFFAVAYGYRGLQFKCVC